MIQIKDSIDGDGYIEVKKEQQTVSCIRIVYPDSAASIYINDYGLHLLMQEIVSVLIWNDRNFRTNTEEE